MANLIFALLRDESSSGDTQLCTVSDCDLYNNLLLDGSFTILDGGPETRRKTSSTMFLNFGQISKVLQNATNFA